MAATSTAAAADRITVPNGDLQLQGLITKPAAPGRYPAIVLLHGCTGMWSSQNPTKPQRQIRHWLHTLPQHGYVAIALDSFSARGIKRACDAKTPLDRAADASAALDYLRSLSYVAPSRIGVVGWSDGGSSALASVSGYAPVGFSTAVAFYPGCRVPEDFKKYRQPAVPIRTVPIACRTRTKRPDQAALATLKRVLAAPASRESPFSPDSWIRTPLSPNEPTDLDSPLAAALRSQIAEFGTWVNTTTWSSPVYEVPADQPRVKVSIDARYTRVPEADIPYLEAQFASVPIPDNAQPAGPSESRAVWWSDHELIVHQPATDTVWELYHLVRTQRGWTATGGGRISQASTSIGTYDPWPTGTAHGMTGAGIPLLSGLQRIDELQRGQIDHVVALSIPHPQAGIFRSPAAKTDGAWNSFDAVPEGTRFRLPADLDIDTLALTPYAKILARAIQQHGMVVADTNCRPTDDGKCPSVIFKAEDPRPRPDASHKNPYTSVFGGVSEGHLLDNFPWDQLLVLGEG